MPSVTRRTFLRGTSVGLAAVGALGALAPVPGLAHAQAMPPATAPLPDTPLIGGGPFTVFIDNAATGAGTILVGERAVPFSNAGVVQALRQAIG